MRHHHCRGWSPGLSYKENVGRPAPPWPVLPDCGCEGGFKHLPLYFCAIKDSELELPKSDTILPTAVLRNRALPLRKERSGCKTQWWKPRGGLSSSDGASKRSCSKILDEVLWTWPETSGASGDP